MNKIATLILIFITQISIYAQIEIYKTYDEYKNNTSTKSEGEVLFRPGGMQAGFQSFIIVKNNKDKTEYQFKDIWGFKYKDVLFRTYKYQLNYTKDIKYTFGCAALVSEGKIFYWENGMGIIEILNSTKEKKIGHVDQSIGNGNFFFSKKLESEIINKRFKLFLNQNPELKQIAECVKSKAEKENRYSNMKMANKLFDLEGEDAIGYLNFFDGINDNEGKPFGLSAGIRSTSRNMTFIRECVKSYNGNFNDLIYHSEFREYQLDSYDSGYKSSEH